MAAEELQEAALLLLLVGGGYELLGLGQILRGEAALCLDETLDEGLVLLEELIVALGHGA